MNVAALFCSQLTFSKKHLIYTYFMPLSVNSDGSSCNTLFSKKSLLMDGSRSGSSPINLENHLKQASRSEGKTAPSPRHCQICFA